MLKGLKFSFKNANKHKDDDSKDSRDDKDDNFCKHSSRDSKERKRSSKSWRKDKHSSKHNKSPKMKKRRVDDSADSPESKNKYREPEKKSKKSKRHSKYDFSKVNPTQLEIPQNDKFDIPGTPSHQKGFTNPSEVVETGSSLIKTKEDLKTASDLIWRNLKAGDLTGAKKGLTKIDNSVYNWLYNLNDESQAYTKLISTDFSSRGIDDASGLLTNLDKVAGKGYVKSQIRDLEKFEDGDYKQFIKKMKEKKLRKKTRVLSNCRFCLENGKLKEYEVLTITETFYILQPGRSSFPGKHLILVPCEHVVSLNKLGSDPEFSKKLENLKTKIRRFFKKAYSCQTLFYESAFDFDGVPHARMEAFAVEKDAYDQAALFFEIGFRDLGGDWDTHKKAIRIQRSKGGFFKQIPDIFEYCYVEWGPGETGEAGESGEGAEGGEGLKGGSDWVGLAHVIEDWRSFNRSFFYEVMGSAMELDVLVAKAPKLLDEENMVSFKKKFRSVWASLGGDDESKK